MKTIEFDVTTAIHLPISERVLDRLADILFASDEILDMLRAEDAPFDDRTTAVERSVEQVYEQVNDLMKTLTD